MNACLKELAERGVDVLATVPQTLADSPFDIDDSFLAERVVLPTGSTGHRLTSLLERFDPDVLLVVSWHTAEYRAVARHFRGRALRVLCMDNQWLGTARQYLGVAVAPWHIRSCFDRVFLPGARQERFARLLGFSPDVIHRGFYSGDVDEFHARPAHPGDRDRPAFVFVGRLVPEKGIADLANAYRAYRKTVSDPWPLIVAGTGPMADMVRELEGVEWHGFVQPRDLSNVLRSAHVLVLPSRFEPWGVVAHEAASMGLALVVSRAVGAGDELVLHRDNGYVCATGSVEDLLEGLLWCHDLSNADMTSARRTSIELSEGFSPERWAAEVLEMATWTPG
jgi:glycosyltransferase involved in cell wall biosynthesis